MVMNSPKLTSTGGSDQDHAKGLGISGDLGLDLGLQAVNLLVQLLEEVLDVAQGAGTGGSFLSRGHCGICFVKKSGELLVKRRGRVKSGKKCRKNKLRSSCT